MARRSKLRVFKACHAIGKPDNSSMLNGWEILLLGASVLVLIGVPLTIAAVVLWVALRKKDSRVPPIIRS